MTNLGLSASVNRKQRIGSLVAERTTEEKQQGQKLRPWISYLGLTTRWNYLHRQQGQQRLYFIIAVETTVGIKGSLMYTSFLLSSGKGSHEMGVTNQGRHRCD